MSEENENLE